MILSVLIGMLNMDIGEAAYAAYGQRTSASAEDVNPAAIASKPPPASDLWVNQYVVHNIVQTGSLTNRVCQCKLWHASTTKKWLHFEF